MGIFGNLFRDTYAELQKGIAEAISEENNNLNLLEKDIINKLKFGKEVSELEYGLRTNFSKKKKTIVVEKVTSKQMYQVLLDISPTAEYSVYEDKIEGEFNGYFITLKRDIHGIHANIDAHYININKLVKDVKDEFYKNNNISKEIKPTNERSLSKQKKNLISSTNLSEKVVSDISELITNIREDLDRIKKYEDIIITNKFDIEKIKEKSEINDTVDTKEKDSNKNSKKSDNIVYSQNTDNLNKSAENENNIEKSADAIVEKKIKFDEYIKNETKKNVKIEDKTSEDFFDKMAVKLQQDDSEYTLDVGEFNKFNNRDSLKKFKFKNGCITINK